MLRSALFFLLLVSTLPYALCVSLRAMTYNVHNAVGEDGVRDCGRIGAIIRDIAPDVVAIQEVDSMTVRSGNRYTLGEIADAAMMIPVFAPAIDHDGGKYGIGILCRQTPDAVRRVPLPGAEEPRAMLIAECPSYVIACVHLSLTPADALASAKIISQETAQYDKPVILAGDWNALPGSETVSEIQKHFHILNDLAVPTWPSDTPNECLDYIAAGKGHMPSGINVRVLPLTVESDHRPVIADITLTSEK